jgi:hypothetical protein
VKLAPLLLLLLVDAANVAAAALLLLLLLVLLSLSCCCCVMLSALSLSCAGGQERPACSPALFFALLPLVVLSYSVL